MVLSREICQVVLTRFPVDMEVSLFRPVSQPIEAHVHCLRSLLFDGVVDDSLGGTIICLDWRGRLWVT